MNKYKCQDCDGLQYSSSANKTGEPCVYCGSKNIRIEPDPRIVPNQDKEDQDHEQ